MPISLAAPAALRVFGLVAALCNSAAYIDWNACVQALSIKLVNN
jgi:hypothetical protein